jgi:hypothetical protein
MNPQPTWPRRALSWGIWCVPFVALTILLHELGHLTAAIWLGFPEPALHYSSISHGDIAGFPGRSVGIVGLAGPAVTVLVLLAACGWIALRGAAPWAVALAITAASRFAVGVPYTIANIIVGLRGAQLQPPAFDEYKAGTALGWSGNALLGSTSFVLIASVAWVAIRLPRGERGPAWTGLIIGTMLGWALWMMVVGPVLLP